MPVTVSIPGSDPMETILLCDECNHAWTFVDRAFVPKVMFRQTPPSSEQISQTLAMITDEERDLDRCDEEIRHLRRAIEALEARRSTLRRNIAHRRSYISAMWEVPAEIWHEIFSFVCFGETDPISDDCKEDFILPLMLSHVCSLWRNIVRQTPRLWSVMRIDTGSPHGTFSTRFIEWYLEQSSEKPLTIDLTYSDKWWSVLGDKNASFLVERLQRHFKTVSNGGFLPQLRSFNLFLSDSSPQETELTGCVITALRDAPQLETVTTECILANSAMFAHCRLTKLVLKQVPVANHLAQILPTLPNIQSLIIHDFRPRDDLPTITSNVVQHLSIGFTLPPESSGTDLCRLVAFDIPNVSSLAISVRRKALELELCSMQHTGELSLKHFPRTLQKLTLNIRSTLPLSPILHHYSDLRELELDEVFYVPCSEMTVVPILVILNELASPSICPNLNTLRFHELRDRNIPPNADSLAAALFPVLQLRCHRTNGNSPGVAQLTDIRLHVEDISGWEHKRLPQVQVFVDELRAFEELGTRCLVTIFTAESSQLP
ncbi:hypothetical protein AAF712_004944 [Marasmius tenuissimus]|uniref:F-box domain-containing protein n=1 Tax=Marasmius tenuissimus TaxID=585030 RepID=A0ABR3A3V7_9AGAR